MDFNLMVVLGLVFLALMLGFEALYSLWANRFSARAKRVAARVAALHRVEQVDVRLQREQDEAAPGRLGAQLQRIALGRRLGALVAGAGSTTTVERELLKSTALFTLGVLGCSLIGRPLVVGVLLGGVLAAVPWWLQARARDQRMRRFEQQLPEALDLMGRAVRAGHSFPTALRMCGDELPDPMGREFRLLSDEINYGVALSEALAGLHARVPMTDVGFFAAAVLIQRESGGNLAELLDKISRIVRDRLKLFGEVRTLSAEGRLSAQILVALPLGVAVVVSLINPALMATLWTDPMGQRVAGMAAVLMVIGVVWMRSVVRVRA